MEVNPTVDYGNLLQQAVALHLSDRNSYEIREYLQSKGLSEREAESATDESYRLYKELLVQRANKSMGWGAFLLTVGLCITIVTYSGSGGHSYILMYGAFIGGLIRLFGGLSQRQKIANL